jgi:hypothetical protein
LLRLSGKAASRQRRATRHKPQGNAAGRHKKPQAASGKQQATSNKQQGKKFPLNPPLRKGEQSRLPRIGGEDSGKSKEVTEVARVAGEQQATSSKRQATSSKARTARLPRSLRLLAMTEKGKKIPLFPPLQKGEK